VTSVVETRLAIDAGAQTVVASAPGRVNLLGEHTDYNDGFVLPTAIPQRTTVRLRRHAADDFVLHAVDLGQLVRFDLVQVPREQAARYVYGCLKVLEPVLAHHGVPLPGLDIEVHSTVPMGVGLSSSAALEVALLRALRTLLTLDLDDVEIARLAQQAEIEYAGVHCGIMDQMASSLADGRTMLFLDTRSLQRQLLPLPAGTELLVIDSGISRSLANSGYNDRRTACEAAAALLGVRALRDVTSVEALDALPLVLRKRARHVVSENARVLAAAAGVDAVQFGLLMNASHASLRDDYEVSVPALDQLVALLQADTAVYGARLTGAGFGGACVALCRAGMAQAVGERAVQAYAAHGHTGRVLVAGAR
jgi:galactokinase